MENEEFYGRKRSGKKDRKKRFPLVYHLVRGLEKGSQCTGWGAGGNAKGAGGRINRREQSEFKIRIKRRKRREKWINGQLKI